MKPKLTIPELLTATRQFCEAQSKIAHQDLIGVTDGKTVGTYIEHKLQKFLRDRFIVDIGSSAKGIDLPGAEIQTDIKVTSEAQPQSSCPYRDAAQKIFGLGYNLLVLVYNKQDSGGTSWLTFTHCAFVGKDRTADYTLTKCLRQMYEDGANVEDIAAYLNDKGVPGDDLSHTMLAERILAQKPKQGYLTISNALQWRLQYKRVIGLRNSIAGVENFDW